MPESRAVTVVINTHIGPGELLEQVRESLKSDGFVVEKVRNAPVELVVTRSIQVTYTSPLASYGGDTLEQAMEYERTLEGSEALEALITAAEVEDENVQYGVHVTVKNGEEHGSIQALSGPNPVMSD